MANGHQDAKKAAGMKSEDRHAYTVLIVLVGRLCHTV